MNSTSSLNPRKIHESLHRNWAACLAVLACTLAGSTGCRQDMQDQPKFLPQRGTTFYADGRSVRPQVPGTVARSQGDAGSYLLTGLIDGKEGDAIPFPATAEVLARGQERYNIYCTPCHSRVGDGLGMIVQRGYSAAANFHSLRLRSAPLGHFVNVMTNGYGAMPEYAAQLTPQDRWAVAAYIRALQLSQNATQADLPPGATIEPLAEIAARTGLPASFAEPWNKSLLPNPAPMSTTTPTPQTGFASAIGAPPTTIPAARSETPPAVTHDANATTTASRAEIPAPLPGKAVAPHDAEAGAQIYKRNCSMCHQPNRGGLPPMIPSLIGVVDKAGVDHIRGVMLSGIPTARPPMPSFANSLSADDISNVIAFLGSPK